MSEFGIKHSIGDPDEEQEKTDDKIAKKRKNKVDSDEPDSEKIKKQKSKMA
ncbi:MAG: hypothetical protein GY870_02380 [archaeon]|nr:hypothetical protein [archaeon]